MAGQRADDGSRRQRIAVLQDSGDRGRRCGLTEHAFCGGEEPVGIEDLLIGDDLDSSSRCISGRGGAVPRRRIPDPDRGCDRLRVVNDLSVHDRGRTRRLKSPHLRSRLHRGVALPIGSDVSCVAHGQGVNGRGLAERIHHLPYRGLLAFDPVRVDGIDQSRVMCRRQFQHETERIVEGSFHGHDGRPVDDRLGEFAMGDLSGREDHDGCDPGAGCVGGSRCRRVSGRGARHGSSTVFERLRHRQRHSPVLE